MGAYASTAKAGPPPVQLFNDFRGSNQGVRTQPWVWQPIAKANFPTTSADNTGPLRRPGGAIRGDIIYATDESQYYVHDGTNWVQLNTISDLDLTAETELTIATGVVTRTQVLHKILPESGSTDDLDTISGGDAGDLLIIRPSDDTKDIVLKHGTGNIENPDGQDITLAENDDYALLVFNGTKWAVLAHKTLNPNYVLNRQGTLAGAGTVTGDAAAIVTQIVNVTGADGTVGVKLPSRAGLAVLVRNNEAAQTLKVYPPTGGTINGAAADAAFVQQGGHTVLFYSLAAGTVHARDLGTAAGIVAESTAQLTLAEMDVLDGATAATAVASKAVVLNSSKDFGGARFTSNDAANLAALGNATGNAAPIVTQIVNVTAADGTKGVILPARAGQVVTVINAEAAQTLKVYPATGGTINGGGVDAAYSQLGGKITQYVSLTATTWLARDLNDLYGYVDIPLNSWREASAGDVGNAAANGGILASDTTPILQGAGGTFVQQIVWASGDQDDIVTAISVPDDLDDTYDAYIEFFLTTNGTTNAPSFTINSDFNGATGVSDTMTGAAQTAFQTAIATIAAADIPADLRTISLFVEVGAHGTDAWYLHGSRLRYRKKLSV